VFRANPKIPTATNIFFLNYSAAYLIRLRIFLLCYNYNSKYIFAKKSLPKEVEAYVFDNKRLNSKL
jgi:uncharacterized membrane protein